MSCAKAVRLVHMLGLSRLDAPGAEFPPNLGEASTWAEEEERRRTFWGTFCIDAHASVSTGWPCLINTDDVSEATEMNDPRLTESRLLLACLHQKKHSRTTKEKKLHS